ncbi:hypothetical protein DI270_001105 [Microbispora triticiradicis]|uniref:Lipoprotein n=3 Tax=Microbispora TaxID=2005 RepID=A0ABY3LTZ4_9ACTN|nr:MULTISPECIES: hypothetical protein [Microbispora]RGA06893.1 hypothetical protein DI270_001105 [Microbispora triticiradicis]TLP66033.1 hypothetical protein FED44_00425 [Microbispora fusca]TYB53549.1 hypothetical protein FXF59_23380 [Microbispora tritici]GLW23466.1 hypothetical protein Mame01_35090 [Microbispora amethystogenes]
MRLATTVTKLAVAVLGAGVSGCGASQAGPVAETPVYVLNLQGSEQGRPDQRPAILVLSEFTTISEVTWHSWGPTRAVGAGRLSGTWCLPACENAPYEATVTLSNVTPVRGKGYFSRYAVAAEVPPRQRPAADLSGMLPTP